MMTQLKFQRDQYEVLASAEKLGLMIANGWSVPITKDDAKHYLESYDKSLNANNQENWGFFNVEGGVVLTHKGAKMKFSNQEADALFALISAASESLWLEE